MLDFKAVASLRIGPTVVGNSISENGWFTPVSRPSLVYGFREQSTQSGPRRSSKADVGHTSDSNASEYGSD